MWLVYSLLAPFFFALVHVLDAFCVGRVFEKPWMGMTTSAFASLVVFVPLPFILPFVQWELPEWHIIVMAMLAGALIQLSQGLYFQSLSLSEAGIVAAYWNMVPAIVPVLSFFIFKEILGAGTYLGIFVLISASMGFCLIDSNLRGRWATFLLMLSASGLQSAMFLIEDAVYAKAPYFLGFLLVTAGIVITGLIPLLFNRIRKLFTRNARRLGSLAFFFIFLELLNLAALAFSQRAVDLGIPSKVAGVETTIPAYTFLISSALFAINPRLGDRLAIKRLHMKFALVGAMIMGVVLVA